MYFKKLELFGFKSFLTKTTILFEPGVTAVVGPNGCGKSNISDAIRWVLGEQSAKSLRGSSMEDVIFNGSAAKEPLNLAEVSLTLSNESKMLPIDYEEVTITRRLYRSGESEYLMNNNTVRLRDITELLMGTGIGTESYSIIEQGKMDMILNSKPEDRRAIFEEAAGITKYKSKKKEALRKLEQTDNNLLRVNDIIQEVKRQIGSVERQAKKAESYKIEFEKLKNLELSVASREFLLFENHRKNKQSELDALQQQENECLEAVQLLESECDGKRQGLEETEDLLRKNQEEELALSFEIRKNQDRVLLNRERVGELLEKRENLLKQIQHAKKRMEEFQTEFENLNRDYDQSKHEEIEGQTFLGSVEAEFAGIASSTAQSAAEEETIRQNVSDLAQRRSQAQGELAKIRAEIDFLARRCEKLNQEEASVLGESSDQEKNLSTLLSDSQGQAEALNPQLSSKVQAFKHKLKAIFQKWFERHAAELEESEEQSLDREIRIFAEEVSEIQGVHTDKKIQLRTAEEQKQKISERLSAIRSERDGLAREQEGLSARAGQMDASIGLLADEETTLAERLSAVQTAVKERAGQKESLLVRLTQTRSLQAHSIARREKMEKDKNWVFEAKMNEERQAESSELLIEEVTGKKETLEAENASLEEALRDLSFNRDRLMGQRELDKQSRDLAQAQLEEIETQKGKKEEFLKQAQGRLHSFQMDNMQTLHEIDRLKERIFNAYQVDLLVEAQMRESQAEADAQLTASAEPFDIDQAKKDIQVQREKLNKMGPVNLVAIQEYDEMKERYDFLNKQQQDLLQAKDDLHKAILKINRTTRELFAETFQKVQVNFTEYFRRLFGGGTAELVLLDENDILESGIEIVARPPGKKPQSITLLSGGEKALTAVALLFSLFKVKPSPFCVLDEIDAPLDESNVDRFCGVLKDFIVESQFILITHNKRTMNLADVMYGITMAETGVSKIVSVRFSEKSKQAGSLDNKEEVLV